MDGTSQRPASLFESLRQHFQSFTGPKSVELPVSAYGKLPVYKDFLRHGLAGSEAQALKKWLDKGIGLHWSAHGDYRDQEISPHALLLTFPATGRQILGLVWGSHDHGALRRFPFVLFVSLPAAKSTAPAAMLHALGQVATQAAALRDALAGLSDVESFYPVIRTTTIKLTLHSDQQIRERLVAAGSELTVAELGESLYGDRAATEWPALVAYLRHQRSEHAATTAVRLPASEALPAVQMALFWCLLLKSVRKVKTPLQVIYAPDKPEAGITVLHRDLRSDDIFGFHMEMPGYEYILDLRQDVPTGRKGPPSLSEAQLGRPFSALLEKGFLAEKES
jgi:type VI secretion system ImpM family protein